MASVSIPGLNLDWLVWEVKLRDRQNRMAFVTELGRQVARVDADSQREEAHATCVVALERSCLAMVGTLCRESMSEAERRRLHSRRCNAAKHWNLLTDLKREDLSHVHSKESA